MQCLVEVVCEGREVRGREEGGRGDMEREKGGRTVKEKRKSLREEVGVVVTIDHRVYSKLAEYGLYSLHCSRLYCCETWFVQLSK